MPELTDQVAIDVVHLAVLGALVDPVCNVAQNPGDLDREMPVFEGCIFRVER
jgi:hypothetical protein